MAEKTFSQSVKDELCEVKFKYEEARAELAAMIIFGENVENGEVLLRTDNASVAARIQLLIRKVTMDEVTIDLVKGRRNYLVRLLPDTSEKTGVYFMDDGEIAIDEDVYEEVVAMRAFLRGAFIISGTITDPQ